MAVIYHVVKEGNYTATALSADTRPLNPPDNCVLIIVDTGKAFKSLNGDWIPAVPIILQNNRWVDVVGSDVFGIGDGSIVNPYRTIQKAIDSITGATTLNPYIINIGLGTFAENITLKNGLSFVGLSKHFLDSLMNLTIISGNVISNIVSGASDCNFSSIEFKGSGNTIVISGSSSADTNTLHFSSCRILSTISATNYSNIIFNDIFLDHPTTNPNFTNNSTLTFYQGVMSRGINTDSGTTLNLYGATEFNRGLSNILGPEIRKTLLNNLYYTTLSATSITGLTTLVNTLSASSIFLSGTNIDNIFSRRVNNFVLVKSLSDLPTPISNIITLISGVTYQINGDIDITNNRITSSGNTLFGLNKTTDILRASTLTGTMITTTNGNLLLDNMQVSCPNGSLFSAMTANTVLFRLTITNSKNIGVFNSCPTININNCITSSAITTNGIILQGDGINFNLDDCIFDGNTGKTLDFDSSSWKSVIINRNRFTAHSGQTIISGTTSSGNIISGGTGSIGNNSFFGVGAYLSGITKSDIRWNVFGNNGLVNTKERGNFNMIGNATSTNIITVSSPIKISGTTTGGVLEKFTHTNGRLTYNGINTLTTFVHYIASFTPAANATKNWRFLIAKNDVVLTASTQKISSSSNALIVTIPVFDNVIFNTNDYVEAWVRNDTDTTDLTIDTLNFDID